MSVFRRFVILPVSFALALCCLAFSSCKLPVNESSVPEVEWEVTKAVFVSAAVPQRVEVAIVGDADSLGGPLYKDFDLKEQLTYDEIVSIPNVSLSSTGCYFSETGITFYLQANTEIANGTQASFYTDWFYKTEDDALMNTTIVAKIRIITKVMDVTIE